MAAFIAGSKIAATTPLLGFLDGRHAQGSRAESFLRKMLAGISTCCANLLRRYGVPLSFYGDKHGSSCERDHWTVEETTRGKRQTLPSLVAPCATRRHLHSCNSLRPRAASSACGALSDRLPVLNSASSARRSVTANESCAASCPTTNRRSAALPRNGKGLAHGPQNLSRICCLSSTSASSQ